MTSSIPYHPSNLDIAVIGNCSFSALIDKKSRINWACMPHFDGDPVFSSLINSQKDSSIEPETGFWDIVLEDFENSEQKYIENTAIVETILTDKNGNSLKITDFTPRYSHYGRFFKPMMICRIIEPVNGTPRIKIRIRPTFNYGSEKAVITKGSNHIRYVSDDLILRLSTDISTSYITNETPFLLGKRHTMILGPDEPLSYNIEATGKKYYSNTKRYWGDFVRMLHIPFEWQEEVIRSAITLKLCTFEETGAIIAGMTSSIPEAPNTQRVFDYRFSWIRDSMFVINALSKLGITNTMEAYLWFIRNISAKDGHKLKALYKIGLDEVPNEIKLPNLKGYRAMGPARLGQHNFDSNQHDGWGSIIVSLTRLFFDKRIITNVSEEDFKNLEQFGEKSYENYNKPDSSIWEHPVEEHIRIHTYSVAMCWAACDRLAKIAQYSQMKEKEIYWRTKADKIKKFFDENCWNEEKQSFTEATDGKTIDASLCLLPEIGIIKGTDSRFIKTVEMVEKELMRNGLLYRFTYEDNWGKPEVAFTVCTFWYIDALAATGQLKKAREKFEFMLEKTNHVGLLSEDMDFETFELWGNFPQTYSMVGLINSAMKLSKKWEDAI